MSGPLRVASFTVHATAQQSARWKQAAEAEGFASAGAWLAAAADAYLRVRARAGQPVPLAWRLGSFRVVHDGEERIARGHVSPPFACYRANAAGEKARTGHRYRLIYLPSGKLLATLSRYREVKALAADLARQWLREEGRPVPVLP